MSISLLKNRPKAKEILEIMAKKGPTTRYDLEKSMSPGAVHENLELLEKTGLIEIKKKKTDNYRGKPRKLRGLSFKGLLYVLRTGIIELPKTKEIRKLNDIAFPVSPLATKDMFKEIRSFYEIVEKYDADTFYDILGNNVDLDHYPEVIHSQLVTAALAVTSHTLGKEKGKEITEELGAFWERKASNLKKYAKYLMQQM